MNVLVLADMIPFAPGATGALCEALVRQLNALGARAEAMRIPFTGVPFAEAGLEKAADGMLVARSLRLANVDRLITLTFPALLVTGPPKVIWRLHPTLHHGDPLGTELDGSADGGDLRRPARGAEEVALAEARHVFADDPTTRELLRRYRDVAPPVVLPPLRDSSPFTGGASDGYVLVLGDPVGLPLRALALAPGLRLVAAHAGSDGDLRRTAVRLGVEDRVQFVSGHSSLADLAPLINAASAVLVLPGLAAPVAPLVLAACHAAKPVIAVEGAGGVASLVRDGTGWVTRAEPQALGTVFRTLRTDPADAARRGRAGRGGLPALGATWAETTERLLS